MIRNLSVISKCFGVNQLRLFARNLHNSNNGIHFSWEKPEAGCIKLNFDGASRINGNKASIGGVYRNHEGVFLLGYAESIGKATSSVAELVAAKRGLELALENGWMNIWIEGDAKSVVDFTMKRSRVKSEEDILHAEEIGLLIPQLNVFSASHIYREGNKVAHRLASMGYGYKKNKPKIWRNVPPNEVLRFLQQDAEGQVILRKTRSFHRKEIE